MNQNPKPDWQFKRFHFYCCVKLTSNHPEHGLHSPPLPEVILSLWIPEEFFAFCILPLFFSQAQEDQFDFLNINSKVKSRKSPLKRKKPTQATSCTFVRHTAKKQKYYKLILYPEAEFEYNALSCS